jgi:HK97 family phage prohead protease
MPWTIEDVDKHKKGLTDKEKEQWVAVANSALESCLKDGGAEESCDISAIKQANGTVEKKAINESKIEIRIIPDEDSEVRIAGNSRNVYGYGIVFNKKSRDLGGFIEIISPEAIEGVLERSDVFALLNHNIDKGILARSTNGEGTMKLDVDKKGVKYSFEAPKFDLGDELIEGIRRGDIKGSSFSFTLAKDEWDYKREPPLRTIKKFDAIYDMSPCYREAYEDTTVALRSLDEFRNVNKDLIEAETKTLAEEPAHDPMVKTEKESYKSRQELYKDLDKFKYKNLK